MQRDDDSLIDVDGATNLLRLANPLVRVIPLPQDLPGPDYHRIIEAIWDSTAFDHDGMLQVEDVVSDAASVGQHDS